MLSQLFTELFQVRTELAKAPHGQEPVPTRVKQLQSRQAELLTLLTNLPLETAEWLEIREGSDVSASVIHSIAPDQVTLRSLQPPMELRTLSSNELRARQPIRKGKWSGHGPIPSPGTLVHVRMNALGPAIVVAEHVVEGWIGLRVRFEAPPDWWCRQNPNPHALGLVFGAELHWDRPSVTP